MGIQSWSCHSWDGSNFSSSSGVAAGLLYALAYTLELALSLLTYFGSTR